MKARIHPEVAGAVLAARQAGVTDFPDLAQYGLFLHTSVQTSETLTVSATLFHESGHALPVVELRAPAPTTGSETVLACADMLEVIYKILAFTVLTAPAAPKTATAPSMTTVSTPAAPSMSAPSEAPPPVPAATPAPAESSMSALATTAPTAPAPALAAPSMSTPAPAAPSISTPAPAESSMSALATPAPAESSTATASTPAESSMSAPSEAPPPAPAAPGSDHHPSFDDRERTRFHHAYGELVRHLGMPRCSYNDLKTLCARKGSSNKPSQMTSKARRALLDRLKEPEITDELAQIHYARRLAELDVRVGRRLTVDLLCDWIEARLGRSWSALNISEKEDIFTGLERSGSQSLVHLISFQETQTHNAVAPTAPAGAAA